MEVDRSVDFKLDALFRTLLATAVDGIIVIDACGAIQVYNSACERLFGYSPGEVIGRNVKMLIPSGHKDHDDYLSSYRKTNEKNIIGISREVEGRRKDGSNFPLCLSVGEGRLGEHQMFVAFIRDLTSSHAETAGRDDADRLLAQMVQSSDDAIVSKTLDGVITSWNGGAGRIFGYSAAEAVGQNIAILVPQTRLAEEDRILAQIRAGRGIEHYETIRCHKNGAEIMVSLTVSPIRDGSGRVVGASKIARDITEKKKNEIRMQALLAELAHVGRLSAMGQMTAAIAHELNQPLAAVTNYVNAAKRTLAPAADRPDEPAKQACELLEKAAAQTLRAGGIIKNLRDFIEKRESHRVMEDLNIVVEEAVTLAFIGTVDSSVKVHLELDRNLPAITIDKIQIQQVLLNLIRNSIEAMSAVKARELTLSTAKAEQGFVQMTVADTGPGLAPEVSARLFQPFVTTKDQGMGIGLMICQSIVESHAGSIGVLPATAGGATFRVLLPLSNSNEHET